ncbi:MAG: hypothetical protein R2708_25955 [Vicinamibacterales bacterium]
MAARPGRPPGRGGGDDHRVHGTLDDLRVDGERYGVDVSFDLAAATAPPPPPFDAG